MLLSQVHVFQGAPTPSILGVSTPYYPSLYRPNIRPEPGMDNGPEFSSDGYFYATCESAVQEGMAVYAKDRPNNVAVASAEYPFLVVGICVKKTATRQCIVQRYGAVRNLFSDLLPQARYLLGINGAIITPPIEDERIVFAQQIATGLSSGILDLRPSGVVIKLNRDEEDGTANVGHGAPHIQQIYPPENVYIDQDSGDWFTMPAGDDELTHFYVGIGHPQDGVTYTPRAVYIDQETGAYYVQGEMGNAFVPISAGQGSPNAMSPNSYRTIYVNQDNGDAYYG